MTTATLPVSLRFDDLYTLPELAQAIEAGFGASFDDPNNYGQILIYKHNNYYVAHWGDDADESRSWSKLEHHFDRLSYRIETCGWQLVARESVERLKAA
ncbi:MAG: hypothetical protein H0U76_25790 [Ktedonobacteraceae bacterium]|nr:hypothetical protein [Ktedonobacteraceae bacterium]